MARKRCETIGRLAHSGPHLVIDRVTKRFAALAHPAVDAVSFTAPEGAFLALLGPSGCGKTTLLRLIAGFESPDEGTVALGGEVVAGAGAWVPPERRGVGMVFQDYALFPHLTVEQNVAFGLRGRAGANERTAQVLDLVGLSGIGPRFPHELSGGQQQRVALARALAPRPRAIVLDEPLSNLDAQMRLNLRREVRAALRAEGVTGVLVTHDQEEALSLADWVGVMRDGRLEQGGAPETLFAAPATRFVAEFVTQANFVDAAAAARLGLPPERGVCMIRQEDVRLTPDSEGAGVVRDRQFLGRDYGYEVDWNGARLRARLPLDLRLAPGTTVRVEAARGHWFPETG
jgi:iron(III) transport system ATP-binding protein